MALSTYTLFTLTEFKEQLSISGDGKDTPIEQIINRATATVEAYLGRQLVTRGNLTESHTPDGCFADLYLLEWPIITVTTVHESAERAYDADSLLTVADDYIVSKPAGKIHRVFSGGGGQRVWLPGFRTVQVVYSAGYANRSAVPDDIRSVCWDLMARKWNVDRSASHGVASLSDATGTVTRFLPSELLSLERQTLDMHRRVEFAGGRTGERDA